MDPLKTDICVVGAGFAGLAAAYLLKKEGKSVVVLEARGRVGGRVYTEVLPDGTPVSWGGTFIGKGHDRIYDLVRELGCETYPSQKGDKILVLDGKIRRFSGAIPRVNPFSLVDMGLAMAKLASMAKEVPLEAPWKAKKAREWDAQTVENWINSPLHAFTDTAKKMLRGIMSEVFMCDPMEVSLLHALFIIHSLTSLEWIVSEDGAQHELLVGGMQRLADRMAEKLEGSIILETPVRRLIQNGEGVTLVSDKIHVKAERAIMALPPLCASRIHYEPQLPALTQQLLERSPAGQVIRCYAIYPEPFWRNDKLNGVSSDMEGVPQISIDASPKEGKPGILTAYMIGPDARRYSYATKEERKQLFLKGLADRFGEKAASPLHFAEFDWSQEEWTRGDMFAHYATGILTGYGEALRAPCGRVHWAGTETATKWAGSMEGAILSGERAATEVLQALPVARSF